MLSLREEENTGKGQSISNKCQDEIVDVEFYNVNVIGSSHGFRVNFLHSMDSTKPLSSLEIG